MNVSTPVQASVVGVQAAYPNSEMAKRTRGKETLAPPAPMLSARSAVPRRQRRRATPAWAHLPSTVRSRTLPDLSWFVHTTAMPTKPVKAVERLCASTPLILHA